MSGHVIVHASVVIRERDRLLFVREEKDASRGKWNLPGGHVEFGETVAEGAQREAKEEVLLGVFLTDLLGVYTAAVRADGTSVRFVFNAHAVTGEPGPGHEITEIRWMTTEDARALTDDEMVAPMILRRILDDVDAGLSFPLAALKEVPQP